MRIVACRFPMAEYVYILVFLTVSFHSLSQFDAEKAGTTPHLKEIVLGRCWNYQLKNVSSKGEPLNCTSMWKAFHDAFAFKNACNLTFADYEPFFDGVVGKYIVNKVGWATIHLSLLSISQFRV